MRGANRGGRTVRRGTKGLTVRELRELSASIARCAETIEKAPDEPFRWAVTWGPSGIYLADRPVSATEAEDIIAGGIWALFESCRDGTEPSDPKAFARVARRVEELARDRCHQSPALATPAGRATGGGR